ncbi:MAG TPA: choice-of-anchor P family protein [Acidimicrobiales bacterium]|nr:choice-of-anchor P family protein [Acidimicrobiales bacterium]
MTDEHPTTPAERRRLRHHGARRMAGRLGAAVAVFALPVLLAGPARAQVHPDSASSAGQNLDQQPSLGGWNVSADGNAVDIVIDNQTGLAGIHPFTEADLPEAQTQFATGPFGSGLATVFWPGAAGANFGSLSSELGFPSQLEGVASKLNDPVKASAQYPLGPATADYPAGGNSSGVAVMHATAQPGGTTADASITNETGAGAVLSFASAKGSSTSTAGKTAKGDATSAISDVSLLGGLIDIGSITSTAEAASDGSSGSGSSTTHVTGVTVLGQKASIGSDGLVLPDFPSALGGLTGPVVQNAISQVISGLGMTVKEFPSVQNANGSGYTTSSGGVSVEIDPPSSAAPILEQAASTLAPLFPSQAAIIPTLPGLLQGMTLTITLGRAAASANASTAYIPSFTPMPIPASPTGTGTGDLTGTSGDAGSAAVASGPTDSGGAAPSVAATPETGGGTASGGGNPTTAPLAQPPAALINLSQPLGAGVVLLGILATLAVGYGLWRLGRMLLPADNGPACPLGQDQT